MAIEYRYIDIIWLDNLIMNFLILFTTAGIIKHKSPVWRLWLAAMAGAFYALATIVLNTPILGNLLFKLALSFIMIMVGFGYRSLGRFLRILGTFYGITFIFGGGAFGLYCLTEGILSIEGGKFYIENFPVKVLFLSSALIATLLYIIWPRIKGRWIRDSLIYGVDIKYGERETTLKGLLDTGNALYDPLTQKPVLIVEYAAVRSILPKSLGEIFNDRGEVDMDPLMNLMDEDHIMGRFRLIPYYALGKPQGMLLGLRVSSIHIHSGDTVINGGDAYIGIYNQRLSVEGDYEVLIHPELLSSWGWPQTNNREG